MTLVEGSERDRFQSIVVVISSSVYTVVVDADFLVGVSDCDVEGKFVVDLVVGEVKGLQSDVVGVEVDFVNWAEDEPDD